VAHAEGKIRNVVKTEKGKVAPLGSGKGLLGLARKEAHHIRKKNGAAARKGTCSKGLSPTGGGGR